MLLKFKVRPCQRHIKPKVNGEADEKEQVENAYPQAKKKESIAVRLPKSFAEHAKVMGKLDVKSTFCIVTAHRDEYGALMFNAILHHDGNIRTYVF